MEERKITVKVQATQSKVEFNSSATTLGDLKKELVEKGIDVVDKQFYEGISRTELIDDNSQLPSNLEYKGTITNDLVFMITVKNKKVESGNHRQDIIDTIIFLNLQQKVKEKFNRSVVCCKTEMLEEVLREETEVEKEEEGLILEEWLTTIENKIDKIISILSSKKVEESEEEDMFDFINN